jgi:hypothetical protein
MMVLVAAVALALGATVWGFEMRRLASSDALRARMHMQLETMHRGDEAKVLKATQEIEQLQKESDQEGPLLDEDTYASSAFVNDGMRRLSEVAARSRRLADHHAALKRKYERAARYPWLTIEPDPPEPE